MELVNFLQDRLQIFDVRFVKHPNWQTPKAMASGPSDLDFPEEFRCPISQLLMLDPVVAYDGHTYERGKLCLRFALFSLASPTFLRPRISTQPYLPRLLLPLSRVYNELAAPWENDQSAHQSYAAHAPRNPQHRSEVCDCLVVEQE